MSANGASVDIQNVSSGSTTVNFQFSDINAVNDFAEPGSTFWRGQGVYFESSTNAEQTYQIREVDGDGNLDSLVTEFTTNSNGVAIINTDQSTIENGQEYVITTENRELVETNALGRQIATDPDETNASQYSWEVQQQTLSASFEDNEVSSESEDPTTTVEVDSNRGSYDLTVSASGLDAAELVDIFEDNQEVIASDSDDETVTLGSISASDTLTANFSGIDQDDYQFTFEGADTSASATANITVSDTTGQMSFPDSSYSEQRGDVATINAEFQSTDDGYIQIGSDSVGYNVTLDVSDGGDGEIGIEMNTFLAGRDTANESDVFSLTDASADDDDSIDNVTVHSQELNTPLEAGTYDIAAGTEVDANNNIETEDDLSTLNLQERRTEGIQLWTAPSGADYDDLEELQTQVNQTNDIAKGDLAVVQLQASGIYGQLAASDDVTEALYDESNGFMLTVEEANPGANQDAAKMAMNGSAVQSVFTDDANNSLYVVVDTGVDPVNAGAQDFEFDEDESYTASWTLNESNPMIDADPETAGIEKETANQDFSITEASAEFDNLNEDDELELASSENAQISGSTSVAPGTELTIRVRSSGSGSSFLKSVETTVTSDRTFSATVDMSNQDVGTNFTAVVRSGGTTLSSEVDGVVVEQVETDTTTSTDETTTSTDETTTSTDETTTDATTTTDGGDGGTTTETTTTNTPGFGVIVALVALVAAALLAVRRDN